jgi:hypothetical protein
LKHAWINFVLKGVGKNPEREATTVRNWEKTEKKEVILKPFAREEIPYGKYIARSLGAPSHL